MSEEPEQPDQPEPDFDPEFDMDLRQDPEWLFEIQKRANDAITQVARDTMAYVTGNVPYGE